MKLILSLLLMLAACGPAPTDLTRCTPPDTASCECDDGASGRQACGADATWQACACAPLPAFVGTWTAVPVTAARDVEAFYAAGTWTQTSVIPNAQPVAMPGCTYTTTLSGPWTASGPVVVVTTASEFVTRESCDDPSQNGVSGDPAEIGITHTYAWSVTGDVLTLALTNVNNTRIPSAPTETLTRTN